MIVCRKMDTEGWFSANFELGFFLLQSMKFAPIYRDTKRVILSSMCKSSQPLIQLEESKLSVQSVHLELPNLAVCPSCTLWANKQSRFKPFRSDRTTPRDRGVPGGHVGACFVGFGGQTRQKTRPEVGHSGSSVGKKNSIFLDSTRRRFDKNREFC